MKKKLGVLSAVVLSSAMILGACKSEEASSNEKVEYNEEGLPIVEEKVSIEMVAPSAPLAPNYNEMTYFKRLEEETNVHIDWNNIPGDGYQEKKNLMLASDDLPDAFYGAGFSDHDLLTYGKSGAIIPLEDLIKEHAPNLNKMLEERPEIKSVITAPDGHIYSLPVAAEMDIGATPFFTSINTTWLEKLDLEMPTTLEEYHDVLVAFKEQDPNGNGKQDEIPLSFMHMFWTADIADLIFGAFGMPDNLDHRTVRDGEVILTASQPEYKEAIKYFHGWVEEGLVDKESFTQDISQYLAKGKTEDVTLGSYVWWETEEVVGPDRADDYALMPPLEGPNGDKLVGRANGSQYSRGAFVITKENQNPEVTMRWIDQQYEPYMAAQNFWGPIGEIYEKDEDGKLVNKEIPEGTTMGEYRQKVAPNQIGIILREHFGTVVEMEPRAKQRLKDLKNIYMPHMAEEKYPKVSLTAEELDTVNRIEPELIDYIDKKRAQWLMNGGVEEEWDTYLEKLEQIGLNEMLEIYQDGLERFKESQK
ncbi:ABC transporter substrate-binding protein [Pontibacillus sp. ALD_SL1]|uniref:ABC transporter substrate-binding protein n=1 Tax=Pontibacillus sp. ALD_SL1 TaxID=2777185 RepID=UPI001A974FC8|nr:ABC transporter substrate-binding protein [Pontibacillus sp. ALD_SL1]QSS98786.1 ABC transporter substrate-binding protein [Pontibacillus sp. ALD_SL1]